MKKKFGLLISIIVLTVFRCANNNIDTPYNEPYRSSELTFFMGELKKSDNIIFPEQYTIVEENDTIRDSLGLHNACIKLTHQDILKFIKDNKLEPPDTSKNDRISPMVFMLIKDRPDFSKSFQREIRNKSGGLFADTTFDKLYISLFY